MRALLLLALCPTTAAAGPVSVDVRGADGKPVAGAVVQIQGTRRPIPAAMLTASYIVAQQNISFQPHLLVVPVGASVSFPNRDKVRHHVYSFSPAKRFELKLYGQQETRSVTFDKPGIIALGCNIHDSMSGFVFVVDTPFAAVTDARGHASFDGVPAAEASIVVWSRSIHTPGNTISQPLAVGAQGGAAVVTVR